MVLSISSRFYTCESRLLSFQVASSLCGAQAAKAAEEDEEEADVDLSADEEAAALTLRS